MHHNDHTSSPDECQEHTATLERFCEHFIFGASGPPTGDAPPRVGLAWLVRAMASGVPLTTIPCELLPQSLPSTTHLAMLARAMIGVQATLLAPVQVLPHGHSSKTRRHDPRWPANEGAFGR